MHTLLLLSVLAQVSTSGSMAPKAVAAPTMRTWSDGQRTFKLYESVTLIAEPSPTDARRAEVLAIDPSATVFLERPTMRIWKTRDAAAVRARFETFRPVFHDLSSGAGRLRVPVGLVCNGVRTAASWLESLERSGSECLPDFWYAPVLR